MKQTFYLVFCLCAVLILAGCRQEGKTYPAGTDADSDSIEIIEEIPDTTVYGRCGQGTTQNYLELLLDNGDTIQYYVGEDEFGNSPVKGGLFAGDRFAVTSYMLPDSTLQASEAINLTTLLGKWISLDKNFEIQEGGVVQSNVTAESNAWTSWKIVNGQLVLNQDTFHVTTLGVDSMSLENRQGIFDYKRQL